MIRQELAVCTIIDGKHETTFSLSVNVNIKQLVTVDQSYILEQLTMQLRLLDNTTQKGN